MIREALLVLAGAAFIFQGIHALRTRSVLHTEHRENPVTGAAARRIGGLLLLGGVMITFFTLLPGEAPLGIIALTLILAVLFPWLLERHYYQQAP